MLDKIIIIFFSNLFFSLLFSDEENDKLSKLNLNFLEFIITFLCFINFHINNNLFEYFDIQLLIISLIGLYIKIKYYGSVFEFLTNSIIMCPLIIFPNIKNIFGAVVFICFSNIFLKYYLSEIKTIIGSYLKR